MCFVAECDDELMQYQAFRGGGRSIRSSTQAQLYSMLKSSLDSMRPVSKQPIHIYLYVWYKVFIRSMVCSF